MMRKRIVMLILAAVTAICCLGFAACGEKKINVTFHGATDTVAEAVAGKEIELPQAPEKAGYTFGGWFADKSLATPFDEKKGYTEDLEVWAKFVPKSDTVYKVEHYTEKLDGTYERNSTEEMTGTTETEVTAEAKIIEHFTYDADAAENVLSGKIAGDGSLVLKLYYTRDSYSVTYRFESKDFATETVKYQGNAAKVDNVPTKAGYTFSGWKNSDGTGFSGQNITGNITVTGTMTADTDTAYKVEYYTEKLDGTYELNRTEEMTGTTDTTATAEAKNIDHFTYDADAAENVLSGKIAGDGSLVLKLYYTRDSYAVTFKNGSAVIATQDFLYGETPVYTGDTPVKEPAGKMFYAFKGWDRAFVPVDSVCEYAATFYEVPSFENWYYCEQTTTALPDLTVYFSGATLKHCINDVACDPAEVTMQAGPQEWKVEVYIGEIKISEMIQRFEVLAEKEYVKQYSDASSEQYLDRFHHETVYTSLAYDPDENAYKFQTLQDAADWNSRIQPLDSVIQGDVYNLLKWYSFDFDIKLGEDFSGTFDPYYGFSHTTVGDDAYLFRVEVRNLDGAVMSAGDMVKGQWYTLTAKLKYAAYATKESEVNKNPIGPYLYLFRTGTAGTMYLKNFRLTDEIESDADYFVTAGKCENVPSKVVIGQEIGGRKEVCRFTTTADAWSSRWQFSLKTLDAWNSLAQSGGEMRFDAYFTKDVFIQFWFIPKDGSMGDFTTNTSSFVTFYDAEGNAVATENRVPETWYTIVIDIDARGEFGVSLNNNQMVNDVGLQFAVANQDFYFDNVEFRATAQA